LDHGERLAEDVRTLAPTVSPERIEPGEHSLDLCELPIHVRDL
jgi:hypothetical protein